MTTGPEYDDRVMELVTAALDKPAAAREAYLRLACAGNVELYREAAEIVTCEEIMGRFMQHPMVVLEDPARSVHAGQIVSDRFEIVRKIGEGGMGIVYEAHDRKRDQRIALKFPKAGFQRLLSPELEGALSVRHPNICLVNQIHDTEIDGAVVDFIAMELVDGETLYSHLNQSGKLEQKEALDVTRQLCAGIAEAHRKGVIHRDLKSGNVMLCRMDEGLRVVVMDFGLAGALAPDSLEGGTPGYMAPELRKGEKASYASDIYALGVILHEIVTGRKPTEENTGDSRKPSRFAAPSSLIKGLDPRWDKVILSCLEESPALRPSDARKVIAALEKKPIRKAPFVAAALLLVAPLAIPSVRHWVRDQIWPPPNVRLAILPFDKSGANTMDMSAGILQDVSERIRHMSSARRTVVVISPAELAEKHFLTSEQARDALHATHVLQVKLKQEGEIVVAQCGIIDLSTRTALREFTGRYSADTLGTMPAALASTASLALGLHGPPTPELLSPAATPAYDRGLYLLRRDQESGDEAIAAFREAARIDPRSPLPLAGLVEAKVLKFAQTDHSEILDDARRDLEAAESLGPDSLRVRLAGLLKRTAGQYEEALDDYRHVVDREPRNEEVLLRIAEIYDKRKMPSEAIATYQKAIQLEPGYYAGYHGLGVFYYYHGDYVNAARQFQKSIEQAPGLDDYINLGAALDELGQDSDAEKAFLTSLKLRETAWALNNMGAMRAYQNRDEEAVAYYRRAVAMNPENYLYIENLADSDRRLGRAKEADAAYGMARDIALGILRHNPLNGYVRGYVAYISARLGERKRAEDEIEQALQMSKGETKVIRHAVLTYEVLGKRDRALQLLKGVNSQVLHELSRQPDLADFCRDRRFKELVVQNSNGG